AAARRRSRGAAHRRRRPRDPGGPRPRQGEERRHQPLRDRPADRDGEPQPSRRPPRERERQERHLVERVAQHVHDEEGADHRGGQRQGRDEGAARVMYVLGYTLNQMTLLALSLAIGLLIDDAVVVREAITHRLDKGEDPVTAASMGTREVGLAVLATTLTLVAVFVPVAFMPGIVGQF